jgi:adenine-specific DNA-methyltransferase
MKLSQFHIGFQAMGMDVHDPVSNTLFPTNTDRIAAWFLDTDYYGRTFCICQAISPTRASG